MMRIRIQMQGLHCASCAQKIEDRVSKLPQVSEVWLNFTENELRFSAEGERADEIISKTQEIIRRTEEGVSLTGITVMDETGAEQQYGSVLKAARGLQTEEQGCDCCGHDHDNGRQGHAHNAKHDKNDAHDHHENHENHGTEHSHDHGEKKGYELVLLLSAVALTVVSYLPFLPEPVSAILLLAAIGLSGYRIIIDGAKKLVRFELEEELLMMIAVVAACVLGEFAEAAMVTLLFSAGTYIEDIAVARSKKSIAALTSIRPDTANLLAADGSSSPVNAKEVAVGSLILLRPGERVPLDAEVVSGDSYLDNSVITGESVPVPVTQGSRVLSGAVNGSGLLTLRTVGDYKNSTASRIIELVESSLAKKGKTERFITRFARYYTPAIMLTALLVAVLPPLLGAGTFSDWISRSLILLVSACPCALVISVPLGFFAGIGSASRLGVLVKGGKYLEALSRVDTMVFDKTGTLTTGKLKVTGVTSLSDYSEGEVLRLAAICENFSSHPVAKAVVAHYGNAISKDSVFSYEEQTGMGVKAYHMGSELICGSARMMEQYGISLAGAPEAAVYVAESGQLLGSISVADTPRSDSAEALRGLKRAGVKRVAILTGDNEKTAREVAAACGADAFHAGLLPSGKVDALMEEKKNAKTVAFVGDGINDAPVLAAADVGIAMGLGSDAAIEAADAVLVSERLGSLPAVIRLSRRAMGIITFNIVFALLIKATVMVLGVAGLGAMWLAIFADVGVTILAVLNTTRLLAVKKGKAA